MVLRLDCNSGIGAHLWSEICNLICLRHLFSLRPDEICIKKEKSPVFLHTGATCPELPSSQINIMESNRVTDLYIVQIRIQKTYRIFSRLIFPISFLKVKVISIIIKTIFLSRVGSGSVNFNPDLQFLRETF